VESAENRSMPAGIQNFVPKNVLRELEKCGGVSAEIIFENINANMLINASFSKVK
jgi:hypothetical protein